MGGCSDRYGGWMDREIDTVARRMNDWKERWI